MPKILPENVEINVGTGYPAPYDTPCLARKTRRVSNAGGLTQFGAHIITIPPGGWSSQRHWHSHEDEFVYIISGHPTFIDDDGEQTLSPGDMTAHPANDGNGHHMINRTDKDVTYLIVGTRNPQEDNCDYPDVDMTLPANGTDTRNWVRKDGRGF